MLSALNEDRVPAQQPEASSLLIRAPLDLVREVLTKSESDRNTDIRNLFSFMADLSKELLLDLATMKTKDPVLLSDLPTVWEVFLHEEKGLAKINRQKTNSVLNKDDVVEIILRDLLESNASLSPEVELRRVLLSVVDLLREERVKGAMAYRLLTRFAHRANDLWLKNAGVGKKYIMAVVHVYLEIFQGECCCCCCCCKVLGQCS